MMTVKLLKTRSSQMARLNDVFYSDVYITPDKRVFVPDMNTEDGLTRIEPDDFQEFYSLLEKTYHGRSSYSVIYEGYFFRVERTVSMYGVMFCMRKCLKKCLI